MEGPSSTREEPARRTGSRFTVRVLWSAGHIRQDPPIEVATELAIGRDAGTNACVLQDRYVSRRHAIVACETDQRTATLRNLSSGGSLVGTVRVGETHPLEDGAVFSVGRSLLLFRREPVWLEDAPSITGLSGGAPAMRALRARVAVLARSEGVVSIRGATGAGKELVARALHERWGLRGAFVPVSCASLPDTLAESLLFGSDGHFRAAAGGTLFLDEIGTLPRRNRRGSSVRSRRGASHRLERPKR